MITMADQNDKLFNLNVIQQETIMINEIDIITKKINTIDVLLIELNQPGFGFGADYLQNIHHIFYSRHKSMVPMSSADLMREMKDLSDQKTILLNLLLQAQNKLYLVGKRDLTAKSSTEAFRRRERMKWFRFWPL